MNSLKNAPNKDFFGGGSLACAGCPATLALKLALRILGENTIIVNASRCITFLSAYSSAPLKVSWIYNTLEDAPATASGIKSIVGDRKNVLVFAEDCVTCDVGFQPLSASAARNDNIIYLCCSNQCYCDACVQHYPATPLCANTSATPAINTHPPKDMAKIIADHNVYSATASLAFPVDFMNKIEKAKERKGFSYIEILATCPTCWEFDASKTVELSRLAVETGFWPLYEIEDGKLTVNYKPKQLKSISEFLKFQGICKDFSKAELSKFQEHVSERYHRLT